MRTGGRDLDVCGLWAWLLWVVEAVNVDPYTKPYQFCDIVISLVIRQLNRLPYGS